MILAYQFLSRCKFGTPTSTLLYSSIMRLYPQNPVFEIVHDESVNVYLHMYNGNVQQNPLCVESCLTKEFSMSPRFSSTIFDPDANSVLLRAHLCTAVDSMRRKPCVRNCSRNREGLYNGNVHSGVDEALVVWSLGGEKPLHSSTPTSLVRRAIALGWRSQLTDVKKTTEYIDPGIEHAPCRNE